MTLHEFLNHPWVEDQISNDGPPANGNAILTELLGRLAEHQGSPVHIMLDGEGVPARFFDARTLNSDERDYYFETMICESEDLPFKAGHVVPIGILDASIYSPSYPVGIYEAGYLLLANLSESTGGQTPIYVISSHSGLFGDSYEKLADDVSGLDIRPGPVE